MTRRPWVLILLMLLALRGAHGASYERPTDLGAYLALQRTVVPSATVTSGFLDWRSVSRYRAHAGLHLGYDVAMPAGSPAVAGWPGQVTAVTAWTDTEFGITVMSPDGRLTTYGHLRPRVRVGDVLNAGDVVGFVAIDHVDVKMRGSDGAYVDFGRGAAAVALVAPVRPSSPFAPAFRAMIAGSAIELARQEAEQADELYEAGAISRMARDKVRARLEALRADPHR